MDAIFTYKYDDILAHLRKHHIKLNCANGVTIFADRNNLITWSETFDDALAYQEISDDIPSISIPFTVKTVLIVLDMIWENFKCFGDMKFIRKLESASNDQYQAVLHFMQYLAIKNQPNQLMMQYMPVVNRSIFYIACTKYFPGKYISCVVDDTLIGNCNHIYLNMELIDTFTRHGLYDELFTTMMNRVDSLSNDYFHNSLRLTSHSKICELIAYTLIRYMCEYEECFTDHVLFRAFHVLFNWYITYLWRGFPDEPVAKTCYVARHKDNIARLRAFVVRRSRLLSQCNGPTYNENIIDVIEKNIHMIDVARQCFAGVLQLNDELLMFCSDIFFKKIIEGQTNDDDDIIRQKVRKDRPHYVV